MKSKAQIQTSKKLSSIRQIEAAIEHLDKLQLECAIVLASAAEGILPPTNEPHILRQIREYTTKEQQKEIDLNLISNWLKHYKPEDPDQVIVTDVDAITMIARAVTKFFAVYRQATGPMTDILAIFNALLSATPSLPGGQVDQ